MSGVMTLMVAGALMIFDSVFEADTTMTSSRLISGSFGGAWAPRVASWAVAAAANSPRPHRARRKRFIDRPPCNETRCAGPSGTRMDSNSGDDDDEVIPHPARIFHRVHP